MPRRAMAAVASIAMAAGLLTPARAADLDRYGVVPAVRADGVSCEGPEVQAFPSVWLGHFTGGYSHYLGSGEITVLDWRDEKLCFPSRGTCNRYIASMRRAFHHPEGYFTCLPIR